LENDEAAISVGRAYYAMFYVAEALLWEEGRQSKSHSGIHSLFGEVFAKTRRLDPKYHRWLLAAFNQRAAGDYGFDAAFPPETVGELIKRASEFLAAAEAFLSSQG
jgi:uncharacterized protein